MADSLWGLRAWMPARVSRQDKLAFSATDMIEVWDLAG